MLRERCLWVIEEGLSTLWDTKKKWVIVWHGRPVVFSSRAKARKEIERIKENFPGSVVRVGRYVRTQEESRTPLKVHHEYELSLVARVIASSREEAMESFRTSHESGMCEPVVVAVREVPGLGGSRGKSGRTGKSKK